MPTVGVIHDGCQMEADLFTPFYKDGYITLILESNHANFQTADAHRRRASTARCARI